MRLIPFLALAALGAGCASTLSTLQTARPVERGHVQVTGGVGAYLPLGPVFTLIKQGVDQAGAVREAIDKGEPYRLSEQAQQELLTAGVALAVMPPSQAPEISLRTGLAKDLDLGLRYSVTSLRLDGKYRFLHRGDDPAGRSLDLALGLGVARHLFEGPVFDVLGFVQLDDFSRWDLEVPLYASVEFAEVLKLYAAPKYVFSRTNLDARLVDFSQQGAEISGLDLSLPARVDTHFYGLSTGIGLGWRHVHLMLELTAGYTACNPEIFGQQRALGGVTLYPAAGVSVEI